MNLTQNDRLKQVTSDTLIVGVDVGSQTHFCRAFDWRGFELSRRVFKFSNTGMGFHTFLRWTEELMNKTEMKKVIVGCEPTGCYWLTFQKFLQDHDIQLVTVNPFTVNRSMELDDNSPEKSDLKDPKTIALLVKDGRFSTSYLPSSVYAEIREASVCRDQIMKQHVRLSNQIQGWIQKFFPEYLECYADWDSTSGLMLLREAPLPQDILKIGAGGINQIWRNAKVRALMIWNPVFQDVFLYYRNRTKNPLGGMQAKIAVACKAIRIFYVVLQTGCDFDEEKFRKDIIRPEAA